MVFIVSTCYIKKTFSSKAESSNEDLILYRRDTVLAYISLMAGDWLETIEDAVSEMHWYLFLHCPALHNAAFFSPDVANL